MNHRIRITPYNPVIEQQEVIDWLYENIGNNEEWNSLIFSWWCDKVDHISICFDKEEYAMAFKLKYT